MGRVVELARTVSVVKAEGVDAALRAADFRKSTSQAVGFAPPGRYLEPDNLDYRATYYFALSPEVKPDGTQDVLAVARSFRTDPLDDLGHSVITPEWLDRIRDLDRRQELASISRLLTVGGGLGMAASIALYRELATDAFGAFSHYAFEAVKPLRSRLDFLGFATDLIGVGQTFNQYEIEPVLLDVGAGLHRLTRRDDAVSRYMCENLLVDLRDKPDALVNSGQTHVVA